MRASRTRKFLEADTVATVESTSDAPVPAWVCRSSEVCVIGMFETVQPRNLGDPAVSRNAGRQFRNSVQGLAEEWREVRWPHSAGERRSKTDDTGRGQSSGPTSQKRMGVNDDWGY
ncbi:MAG: hypothetical protein ACE5IR_23115 [bacterium]